MGTSRQPKTRPCLGCEGNGFLPQRATPVPDRRERGGFWRCGTCASQNHETDGECQFCECGGLDCTRWNCADPAHFVECPSCLGLGTQEDRRTAEQAMVDAATVKAFSSRRPFLHGAVRDAEFYGARAAQYMHEDDTASVSSGDVAYYAAQTAARAAFRACPGLRGE